VEEHGLALRVLEVERDALLVGVEQQEVARVDTRLLGAPVTPRLTLARLLDLDDLGAEPRQHLRARRTSFELTEVQHTYAVKRCAQCRPPVPPMIPRAGSVRSGQSANSAGLYGPKLASRRTSGNPVERSNALTGMIRRRSSARWNAAWSRLLRSNRPCA